MPNLLPENESVAEGRAFAKLSIVAMPSLCQEIPAVSSAKDEHVQACEFWLCKPGLMVVLKTERGAHLQECARSALLRTLSNDHVEVRERSASTDLRVLAAHPM